jgi:putative multiple sugar transport system substrate-binding protein
MKKWLSIITLVSMMVFLTACSSNQASGEESGGYVGISMPTKSSERWVNDGENMAQQFKALGYKVDLQYAEDIIENQAAQIENMITKGVDVLVIAPIDGQAGLTNVLERAHKLGIKIITYDRLIQNSKYIDYYATFDNFEVGVQQGTYIEEKLGLKEEDGPFNIELFAGSPDDNNAYFFFDGAMSILQPYIDSGKAARQNLIREPHSDGMARWPNPAWTIC